MSEMRKLYNCLQDVDFLNQLKVEELEKLLAAIKKRSCPAGTVVFKQGDPADAFFMVSVGKLSVWTRKAFKSVQVDNLGPQDYFGDNALLGGGVRAATVKADTDCELYVIYKNDFDNILMANPGIAAGINAHRAQTKAKRKL